MGPVSPAPPIKGRMTHECSDELSDNHKMMGPRGLQGCSSVILKAMTLLDTSQGTAHGYWQSRGKNAGIAFLAPELPGAWLTGCSWMTYASFLG